MNNKLNIQDLVSALAERYNMDSKAATAFVRTVFEIVEEYITKDKLVKIKGLGTFKLVSVSDRESINVNTGERILIAGHSKLSFTPDAALKDAVNRPFSDFETTVLRDDVSTEEMERIPVAEAEDRQPEVAAEETTEVAAEETTEVAAEETTEVAAVVEQVPAEQEHEDVSAVEETPAETPKLVVQQENNMYPLAAEPLAEENKSKTGMSTWLWLLLTLLLMVLAYVAGCYRVHDMLEVNLYPEEQVEEQPLVAPQAPPVEQLQETPVDTLVQKQDSIQQDTVSAILAPVVSNEPQEDAAELAKYYPQVKYGDYWIVGFSGRVHLMAVGETLYSIAKDELGDRNLVRYLIVFNDFDDPNVIHKGDTIRIPRLVKKQPTE